MANLNIYNVVENNGVYKMTENVNKIVSLFQSSHFAKLEGQIRIKDLKAAATILDEPIFISKGNIMERLFEKGTLLDFDTVRNRYLGILDETLLSFNKMDLKTGNLGSEPHFRNIWLYGFSDHIKSNYYCFYPYSADYRNNLIKWKCENIMESYNDNNDGFYVWIDEETVWIASNYTIEFVNELKNQFYKCYELDEDCGLSYNGVEGIKIDEEDGSLIFYTWDVPDGLSRVRHIRWELLLKNEEDNTINI